MASVPANITITSGDSGTFTITTSAVTVPTTATIIASYDGTFVTAMLTINPAAAPSPITIPTIFENITTTDSLGNNSTLISATVISPIVETITTTDSLGSNSTLISATVIPPITENITTVDTPSAFVANITIQLASVTAALVTTTPPGHLQVTVTITNTGNVTASNVYVITTTLGGVTDFGYAGTIADLAPGASASYMVNFPPYNGPAGSKPTFSVKGSYSGDGLSGTWSASLRGVTVP